MLINILLINANFRYNSKVTCKVNYLYIHPGSNNEAPGVFNQPNVKQSNV